jgi:hypothetical protein
MVEKGGKEQPMAKITYKRKKRDRAKAFLSPRCSGER